MVGLGAVPSIILFLVLPLVPESPRYLVKQGRIIEARLIISKTFPNATQLQIDNKTQIFEESVKYLSKQLTITEQCLILFDNPANFHALAIACGLMATQQFCGFNTLMYYSGIIFQNVGFTNPIAVGIAVPLANFIFTCISITCIDSIGRRKLLVWTVIPF
jgi:SP family myo-inositol transporter-like MFS transporter 13